MLEHDEGGRPWPTREMRRRAEEMLAAVGLSDRAQYKTRDLSDGQQQRVAIARAMVRRPPLVLADEPRGSLNTASADDVFELMRRFNREHHTPFLVVTHDPRIAARSRSELRGSASPQQSVTKSRWSPQAEESSCGSLRMSVD